MEKLVKFKLKDADLMTIKGHLANRYKNALQELTGHTSNLTEFRIDAMGFSPEIAAEIGDPLYLNPHSVNRKYILVTLEQAKLPVLDESFSSTQDMLKDFISRNREALFVLTSHDAVCGELNDNTYKVTSLEDILSIKQIDFSVHTPSGFLEKTVRLKEMISQFENDKFMWMDNSVIQEMMELSKETGDIRNVNTIPDKLSFGKKNFYTNHFGGLYVFGNTVIHVEPEFKTTANVNLISLNDKKKVITFLYENNMVMEASYADPEIVMKRINQAMEFIVFHTISEHMPNENISAYNLAQLKKAIYDYHDKMPAIFKEMERIVKKIRMDEEFAITFDVAPYVLPVVEGPNKSVILHLLSHYCDMDYIGNYIYNRPLFYKRYETWPDNRKDYVINVIGDILFPKKKQIFEDDYFTHGVQNGK